MLYSNWLVAIPTIISKHQFFAMESIYQIKGNVYDVAINTNEEAVLSWVKLNGKVLLEDFPIDQSSNISSVCQNSLMVSKSLDCANGDVDR